MLSVMDVKSKFAEYEYTIKLLTEKLEELAETNERLQAGLDAHSTLQSIYRDESAPRSDRIKAANGAIAYEQPKLGSILPSVGSINRAERWRMFEMWSQRRQYIIEHRDVPPPNWDAHLQADVYTPPEGDAMPPVDVIDTPSGFKVLTNLLPKSGQRRDGNGNGSDGDAGE
jgi:hypothetical protein